jgi:UPF0755 protein
MLEIPAGMKLREIASLLEREGLILNRAAFLALAALHGEQGKIRAGTYRIDGPGSARLLLEKLTRGEVAFHRITIPEGWTLTQIADRLASDGLVQREPFLQTARDPGSVEDLLGFRAPSLEGFLFPDTYHFTAGAGESKILRTMIRRFHQALDPVLRSRAEELGFSVLEAVTLASLIEKETSVPEERSVIAGVFHRRLRIGMKLETDPTVIYGLESFRGGLRKEDMTRPHPYNTYVIGGLPPGPICSPGKESLTAALFPTDREYLYFVSRKDGSHHFSRTYPEHLRAVARYQRRGR